MTYLHQMIIDNIGKIVGRETVRLDKDLIVKLGVLDSYLAVIGIRKGRCAFAGNVLPDYKGLACCQLCLDLFFGKRQTMLVVVGNGLAFVQKQ